MSIYRSLGHGRSRLVRRLRANGTRRWRLRSRIRLARGRYVIAPDAVDRLGQHQLPDGIIRVTIG